MSTLEKKIHLNSADSSTTKLLFELNDGELIESVLMRYTSDYGKKGRKTACISTQAGCALGCTFCATGQQGFRRNLTSGEIIEQVLQLQKIALEEDFIEVKDGKRKKGGLELMSTFCSKWKSERVFSRSTRLYSDVRIQSEIQILVAISNVE